MDIGQKLQQMEARIARIERSARLSHAAIDDTAIEVRDGTGGLRGILGVQSDGTTAVNIVNGAAPPAPSTPTVASALGGIAAGWDGTFADNAAIPLDWSRVEVHASTDSGFTAGPDTLQATIETPQGAIAYLPASAPTYVRLLARNTSGTASEPTAIVGPYSPTPVAGEIGIGEITETMISDGAVTTPKLFANAVTTPKLAAGSVDAVAIAADAITGKTITGGTITGTVIQTATSGQRITLNETGTHRILVYNSSGAIVGELSALGMGLVGSTGAKMILDPNATYPTLRMTNAAGTNEAIVNVVEGTAGAADIGINSGKFTASGLDWKWRTFFGNDFAVMERVRDGASTTNVGGRVALSATAATIGFNDTTNATADNNLTFISGTAQLNGGRLEILPDAAATSALYVNAASGHTGNLLRLLLNAVEKFRVDKDGNVLTAGDVMTTPITTTTGLSAASGFSTNNFYGYKVGKLVVIDLYMNRTGATITATSGNITPDVAIATLPAGWRPTHSTINGTWDDGTATGGWVVGTDGICTLRTATSDIANNRNLRLHITFIQD
ncbi:hypothetical protein [Streptomyces chartreusis]|uniref:hypothetical protein n=1 Tax=Streptomyces chartreusis TaxID=1969 RepID=UPI0037DCB665|nr:hypothetical protein OG938_48070 [Streptomyces chartreusis]